MVTILVTNYMELGGDTHYLVASPVLGKYPPCRLLPQPVLITDAGVEADMEVPFLHEEMLS